MEELIRKKAQLQINSSKIAVINVLLEKGPLSRPEIMKQTGLSQTSIHEVTKELVDRGILLERGIGESSGGRKPVLLEVSTEVGFALGIKVDANGITTAVVDLLGNIVHRTAAELPKSRDEESITAKIAETITNVINESGKKDGQTGLLGIGIGISGIVNAETGVLLESPILKLKNIRLRELLEEQFEVPVFVDHDVNVLLSAETRYGRWKNEKNILCVMVGNGIGGGIILDSRVYRGSNGASAEFGHMVIDTHGPLCRCGKHGCLTTLASDQYAIDQAQKLLEEGRAHRLQNQLADGGKPSVDLIIKAALSGDPDIDPLYKSWVYNLALGIDNLIRIFDPQIILVGRESVPTEPELIETLTGNLREINTLSLYSNVKLMPFSLEKDGWNIGAADLVFQKVIREPLHK